MTCVGGDSWVNGIQVVLAATTTEMIILPDPFHSSIARMDTWIGLLPLRRKIDEQLLHSGGHIGYVIRPSKRGCGYGRVLLRLGLHKARECACNVCC